MLLSRLRRALPPELPPHSRTDVRKLAFRLNRHYYQRRYGYSDFDPMAEPWDTLVILDAARPDLLRQVADEQTTQRIETRRAPASCSREYIDAVWNGRTFHDTVYVTANPHVYAGRLDAGTFHAVEECLTDAWDAETQTVLPECMVERALAARERYPDKRLIVHLMQPHYPFIGATGQQVAAGIGPPDAFDGRHPWEEAMWGTGAPHDALVAAYRENHAIALEHAQRLADELAGRTTITADHANLIGERGVPYPMRMYGHPIGVPHPALTRVPWLPLDGTPQAVTADPPVDDQPTGDADEAVVEDRLEALGYA